MPPTIEPPKQADFSKVSRGAVDGWMSGLKEAEQASNPIGNPPPDPPPPADPSPPPEPPKPAEPPKSSEKPPETPPNEPADADSPDRWPRSAVEWKKFIKVRDDNYAKRDTRIKELETKLADQEKTLKSLPADPTTFETLKAERERFATESKDLSERLRLAAIEQHPKFKAYYDGKVAAQVELAKRVVGPDKADAVAEALKMPDGSWKTARLEELSTDLSPVAASRLGSVLNAIEEIQSERQSEIARAKTDYETAQTKAAADQKAAREQASAQANTLFESIVKQVSDPKDGIALFQLKDGDEAWNKTVKARIDGARSTLFGNGSANPDQLIRKALVAEAFPSLLESYNALLTELGSLKAQVDKLSTANPTIQPRPASGAPDTTPKTKPGSRPMEVAADWMKGLQQASQG